MKNILNLIIVVFMVSIGACGNQATQKISDEKEHTEVVEVKIFVEGMTCGGCEMAINTSLQKLPGVDSTLASHIDKQVVILVDTNITTVVQMEMAIEELGYKIIH